MRIRILRSLTRDDSRTIENPPLTRGISVSRLFLEACGLLLASVELVDGGRLENALFAGVERVALGAAFDFDFVTVGAHRGESVSAGAGDLDFLVIRVDVLLHMKGSG